MRRGLRIAGVLALLLAVILLWPSASEFFAVDSCLDTGGSFDYVTGQCDHTNNHPYADTWAQHGKAIFGAFICVVIGSGLLFVGKILPAAK
jgi:hypothetical protein